MYYEVKCLGTTIEFTKKKSDAEDAFNRALGQAAMLLLIPSLNTKTLLQYKDK